MTMPPAPDADAASRSRRARRARHQVPSATALLALGLAAPPLSAVLPDGALFDSLRAAGATSRSAAGLDGARRVLEPYTSAPEAGADAARARTVLGLLAHVHDEPLLAEQWLKEPGLEELDDWRLSALADAAAARGGFADARRALDQLLSLHPGSPLRPRALLRTVELAAAAGDLPAAKRWIAVARAEPLAPAIVQELERRAWQLARDHGDVELMSSAARRLLVEAPLEASRLKVVDTLTQRRATAQDWRLWLSPDELERRARALLDVDLPAGALTTLEAVPAEARDFEWRLLEARALTAGGRAAEAHRRLAQLDAPDALAAARLDWRRAEAAAAAAKKPAVAADGERFRRLAREHRLAVARSAGDPELAAAALRLLAADYLDDNRVVEALAALRQILALEASDTTGARPLWEKGWAAYQRRDLARATGLWRDLVALYPAAGSARSARYWSARALEQLGQKSAARQLYLEVAAAGTADFYARQASLRLAGATATQLAATPERELWPTDERLARAAALAELGLDKLAVQELALIGASADQRAAAALEAVVFANGGDRRASLSALRRAFPDLGTAHQESVPERALALFYPADYRAAIARAAAAEGLPVSLVYGIVHQESGFDASATSRSGARGLMQIMPSTGKEVAHRLGLPFSTARLAQPDYSLRLGTRYFRQLLGQFDGSVELALAGYNGGPGRIGRLWRAAGPSPELDRFLEGLSVVESRNYVKRILLLSASYRSLYPDLG